MALAYLIYVSRRQSELTMPALTSLVEHSVEARLLINGFKRQMAA